MKIKHKDKYLHIAAGAGISVVFLLGWFFLGLGTTTIGTLLSIWAAWSVGTAKEFYDDKYGGVKDGWDAQATTLGGLIGISGLYLVLLAVAFM